MLQMSHNLWLIKPSSKDSNCHFLKVYLGLFKNVCEFQIFQKKIHKYFWEKQWKIYKYFLGQYLGLEKFIRKLKVIKHFYIEVGAFHFKYHLISTPCKKNFLWKNLKTKINQKTWSEILYTIGVSKSIILEAEISTPTPLIRYCFSCIRPSSTWEIDCKQKKCFLLSNN
jgi:hypothetical protein